VPRAARLAVLVNPNNPFAEAFIADIRAAAPTIPQIDVFTASTSRDIDAAFAKLVEKRLTRSWWLPTPCLSAAAFNSPR